MPVVDLFKQPDKLDLNPIEAPSNFESKFVISPMPLLASSSFDPLSRAGSLFPKMSQFSSKICTKLSAAVGPSIESLDELSIAVKERFDEFAQQEPSEGEDREKRIKQIKSILTQKRRALFDLFTEMRKMGLRFKKGLGVMKDSSLLNQLWPWLSTNVYYTRIIHRFTQIKQFLSKPDKALSKNEFDRAVGYAFGMLKHAVQLRASIDQFRTQIDFFTSLPDSNVSKFSRSSLELTYARDAAESALIEIINLKRLLQSAPDELEQTNVDLDNVPSLCGLVSSSEKLQNFQKSLESFEFQTNQTISKITKILNYSLITEENEKSAVDSINLTKDSLKNLRIEFITNFDEENELELVGKFEKIESNLGSIVEMIHENSRSEKTGTSTPFDLERMNKFVQRVMIIYQEHLTKLDAMTTSSSTSNTTETEPDINLQLPLDFMSNLALPEEEFSKIKSEILNLSGRHEVFPEFLKLINPFVEMSKFILILGEQLESGFHKMIYTHSSICSFLLQRGFCLPEDIADEVLEQEGAEIGGGGAGAGDAGENDVSEEFDKEDLEDPLEGEDDAGDKPDKGNKGDDNAVDMEDNRMDGNVEDVDDDDDGEADPEDKEQLDDEMGDLDEDDLTDKMDEKVWGDDEDKDEIEEKENKNEESGKGDEKKKQDELQAKDDDLARGDEPESKPEDEEVEGQQEDMVDESEFDPNNENPDDQQTENQNDQNDQPEPDLKDVNIEDVDPDEVEDTEQIEMDNEVPENNDDENDDEEETEETEENSENNAEKGEKDEAMEERDEDDTNNGKRNNEENEEVEDENKEKNNKRVARQGVAPEAEDQQTNNERAAEQAESMEDQQVRIYHKLSLVFIV